MSIERISVNGKVYDIADVEGVEAERRRAQQAENDIRTSMTLLEGVLADGSFVVAVANLANAVKAGAVTFEMLDGKLRLSASVVDDLETANTLMPLSANQGKVLKDLIDVINGSGEGSTDKKITDAMAALVDRAPENLDTLRELAEWTTEHGTEFAAVIETLQAHSENLANLNTTVINYHRMISGNFEPVDKATVVANLGTAVERGMVVTYYSADGWKSIRYISPKATAEAFADVNNWEDVYDFSAEDKVNMLLTKQATHITQVIATADEAAKYIIQEYIFTIGKEYRLISNSERGVSAALLNDGVGIQSLNNNQGVIDKDLVFTASSNANAIRLYSQGNIDITIYPLESIHYLEEKNQEEFPKKVDKVYTDSQHIVVNGVNGRYTRWAQDHTGWLAVTTGLTIKGAVTFGNITLSITSKDSAYNLKNNIVTIPIYTTYDGAQNVKCVTDFTGDIKLALDSNKRLVVLLGGNDYVWRICEIGIVNIDIWTNSNSISYGEYITGDAISTLDDYTIFNNVIIERIASQSYVTEAVNKAKETFSQFDSKNIELSLSSGYYDSELVAKSLNTWQKAEIDVSQYQGCLVKIKTKTRATDATGTVGYCGFVDEDGNKIHSFTGRYVTSVMEDDVIILPIPRAFDAQNVDYASVSYNGASKLRISTLKDFDCSVEIVTKCYDNRLRGKNIAVVGSSNAALYFNGDCRINKGWFLYHLAPLFGYNCSVRNVGGSGWGDINRQFNLCKQDITTTAKDYFDVVYLAETTNDGMGQFLDDYNLYVQGFCKELLYSGQEVVDSGLNEVCKTACNSIKEILNHSPRARLYIPMQFFNSNDYVEGKGALYLGQELKYENNFLKALCDVFNIKKISYSNGSSYRVWKEGPWYVWQGQSNGNSSDIKSGQQVLDQGDGIHASKPRGGWDQFKVLFSNLWNDFAADAMF